MTAKKETKKIKTIKKPTIKNQLDGKDAFTPYKPKNTGKKK